MKTLNLIFPLLVYSACTGTKEPEFFITGYNFSIPDSTTVLMINRTTLEEDSTFIIDGRFQFKGKVDYPTLYEFKGVDNKKNKLYFIGQLFVENSVISIEKQNENLIVKGSKSNEIKDAYYAERRFIHQKYSDLLQKDEYSKQDSLQLGVFYQELKASEFNFLKANPNAYFTASQLMIATIPGSTVKPLEFTKEEISEIYAGLSDEIKNTQNGQAINQFINLQAPPQVGERYLDFTFPDVNGNNLSLSYFEGKYILIDFWASWCGPCRLQNPKLKKIFDDFSQQNFTILGVSIDEKKDHWLAAVQKDKLPWTNVHSKGGRTSLISQLYGINGLPDNVLINPDGIIIQRNITIDKLEEIMNNLFSR